MPHKIQIYIKTQKTLQGQYYSPPISDGVMTHTCLSKKMLEYEKTLPEPEKQILEYLKTYCQNKDIPIEIIDTSTFKGKLKAKTNGITTTPTITINQKQIQTPTNLDTLKQQLETQIK